MTIDFDRMSMKDIMDKIKNTSDYAKMIKCADIYDNVSKAILLYKTAPTEFYVFYSELLKNYREALFIWENSKNALLSTLSQKSLILINVYFEIYENISLQKISIKDN